MFDGVKSFVDGVMNSGKNAGSIFGSVKDGAKGMSDHFFDWKPRW